MDLLLLFLIVAGYVGLVFVHAKELASKIESKTYEGVFQVEEVFKKQGKQRDSLDAEKKNLQNESFEIFTLYEITKEIANSLSEEEAFEIFKEKLHEHITFKECQFLDPLSGKVAEIGFVLIGQVGGNFKKQRLVFWRYPAHDILYRTKQLP